MNSFDLKRNMMELWKSVFHDSDEYIKLIFDSYFNSNNIAYKIIDGRVVSSLFAIIFEFGGFDSVKSERIRGAYLCGLATDPEFRKRGFMGELMQEIEIRLKKRGIDFMFLIPADSDVREYYRKKGFVDSFYRESIKYKLSNLSLPYNDTEKTIIKDTKDSNYYFAEIIDIHGNEIEIKFKSKRNYISLNNVYLFIHKCENIKKIFSILHSKIDVYNIIKDSLISDDKLYLLINSDDNNLKDTENVDIESFFILKLEKEKRVLEMKGMFNKDRRSFDSSIYHLSKIFPGYSLVLNMAKPVVDSTPSLKGLDVNNNVSEKIGEDSYGLIKILNSPEILKFVSNISDCSKKSILAKNGSRSFDPINASANPLISQSNLEALIRRGEIPFSMNLMLD